jgi:hypothetical protein
MSECVVRMEMPENCECCPMVFTADVPGYHWCAALEQEVEQGLSRPKDCPIICSLPEGHGRLGDLDELDRKIYGARIRAMQDGQDTNPYWECGDIIVSEQTIVPAEAERRE